MKLKIKSPANAEFLYRGLPDFSYMPEEYEAYLKAALEKAGVIVEFIREVE